MEGFLGPLLPLFERERAAGRSLALGVLVHTEGSTYRKPGALTLIAGNGEYAGLLSGGCLEGDLGERARSVIATGAAQLAAYDLRGSGDLLWGLGLGCEGALRILLLRAGPHNGWQPLAHLSDALAARAPTAVGLVCESTHADAPVGSIALPAGEGAAGARSPLGAPAVQEALARCRAEGAPRWVENGVPAWKMFVLPLALPPRVLVLGAGPDALPLVNFAALLDWKVTLVDHRPARAIAAHFPAAERVIPVEAEALAIAVDLDTFRAAVVMSHHLPADLAYLRALASARMGYVGLLGPAQRRDRLLQELGSDAQLLRGRLRAPVGLPLGGRTPEAVALAIVAELHAFLS